MNDLSPAARELVDAHRTDGALTPADRKRIKQKVLLQVAALGAATAVAGRAAGMSLASKVVIVALCVTAVTGVVSVSLRGLRARAPSGGTPSATSVRTMTDVGAPTRAPAGAPTVVASTNASAFVAAPAVVSPGARAVARIPARTRRAVAAAPAHALARGPVAAAAVVAAPASSAWVALGDGDRVKAIDMRPAAPAAEKEPPVEAQTGVPDPEPELQAVREARNDLRAGRPASAYRRLEDFDRLRGGGMLVQERRALSTMALCQWQPGPQARARAAEFLRSSPESPLAVRVKSACEAPRKAPQ